MPTKRIGAAALAVISAAGLAGCARSATVNRSSPPARSVLIPPTNPTTTSSTGPATTSSTSPALSSSGGSNQYAGMSAADWEAIDQALSGAQSALSQSDADAAHN